MASVTRELSEKQRVRDEQYTENLQLRIGEIHGLLTVIGIDRLPGMRHRKLKCHCTCGNTIYVPHAEWNRRHAMSCGCNTWYSTRMLAKSQRKPPGVRGFMDLLGRYKVSAKYKKRVFELSLNEFKTLVDDNCHYCNTAPTVKHYVHELNGPCTNEARELAAYIYNGIDRLDPSIGYTRDNCVTCCKTCNVAKMAMTHMQFLLHIEKIYKHALKNVESSAHKLLYQVLTRNS